MSALNQESVYLFPETPIVLIHPRSADRTRTVATLSSQPETVYYALTEADQRGGILTQNVLTAFSGISQGDFTSLWAAGNALGAALLQKHSQRLILDHADRLNEPDLHEWLDGLAVWLMHGQLIVSGREIRLGQWQPALTEGRATLWTGSENNEVLGGLEIYGFGHGQARYADQIRDNWDGPLARRLFYYLIDRSSVSRDQIFAVFWSELSIREATNVFHVTKRKVNETIGCEAMAFVNRRYVPNPAIKIYYDVAAFESAIQQAEALEDSGSEAEAYSLWQKAIALYQQPFLPGESIPWIVSRREALRERYAQALTKVARGYHDQRDIDHALTYWLRAINESPLREDWTAHAMKLHAERGDLVAVREQYESLRKQLSEQLSMQPSQSITQMYQGLIGRR